MGVLVGTQEVRIPAASGQDHRVVVGDLGILKIGVDLQPACVLHQAHSQHMGLGDGREAQAQALRERADLRCDDVDRGAVLAQPAHGAENLDLFHTIGAADGNALSLQQMRIGGRIEEKVVELAIQLAVGHGEKFGRDRRYRRSGHELLHARERRVLCLGRGSGLIHG